MSKLQVSGKILATVFLLAFALRLISLNQPLRPDEAQTAQLASSHSFVQLSTNVSASGFNPPLYNLLLKAWINVAGVSEIALRFPSITLSLLTGWVVYLIGRELKDKKIGLYASIFFLFNPLVVYYSQEVSANMTLTFLMTTVFFYILRIHNKKNKHKTRDIILANTFIGLSILTNYGSIFFILPIYLYTAFKKDFRKIILFLPGLIVSFFILLPLLTKQFAYSKGAFSIFSDIVTLAKTNLFSLILIPVKFTLGNISFEPKPLYYTVAFFWAAFIFYIALRKIKHYSFLFYMFITPIALGFFFSFYKPIFQYQQFVFALPFLSVLIALGSQNRPQRIRILLGFFFFSCAYLLNFL